MDQERQQIMDRIDAMNKSELITELKRNNSSVGGNKGTLQR